MKTMFCAACCAFLFIFSTHPVLFAGEADVSPERALSSGQRPENWAIALCGYPGLKNFFRLSDNLYRGAQPEEEGFAHLKKLGIKTVINLRTFHSDKEHCEKAGLKCVSIKCQAWDGEDKDVVAFLKEALNPSNQPVFVHCQHGADRTGVMCAVYRIIVQKWSKEDALKEMTEGGYGFHSVWSNLVEYVKNLDMEKVREKAGIPSPSEGP